MKSKSIWNVLLPYGMGLVVRPLAVTYSVTCQEWLIQGLCVSRILPTICVHMCRVAQVSLHASRARLGHVSVSDREDDIGNILSRGSTTEYTHTYHARMLAYHTFQ